MADPIIHGWKTRHTTLCGLEWTRSRFSSSDIASLVTCKRCLKNRNLKP